MGVWLEGEGAMLDIALLKVLVVRGVHVEVVLVAEAPTERTVTQTQISSSELKGYDNKRKHWVTRHPTGSASGQILLGSGSRLKKRSDLQEEGGL